MQTHKLKSWSPFFQAIKHGYKKHDLRYDADRHFKIGDKLLLEEYDQVKGVYTGERLLAEVTFITGRDTPCALSSAVLQRDYVILSLKVIKGGMKDEV